MHCSELQEIKTCALVQLEQHVRNPVGRASRLTQTSKTRCISSHGCKPHGGRCHCFASWRHTPPPTPYSAASPHMTHFFLPRQALWFSRPPHFSRQSLRTTDSNTCQSCTTSRTPPFIRVLIPYSAEGIKKCNILSRRTLLEWNRKCAKLGCVCSYVLQLSLWHLFSFSICWCSISCFIE